MTAVAPPTAGRTGRARLALLLVVSYALRVCLAMRGGEDFWPDEARYGLARDAVYEFAHRQWGMAFRSLLGGADHVFFRWLGLPAAALQYLLGGSHPALAACYFGLFSVGAIWLIWAVALEAGASGSEALWAAVFAAASDSLFYYTRHYLPYDASLFEMLVCLWLAIGPWSPTRSALAGVAAAFGFLTYNGYWLLGACILCLHALLGAGGLRRFPARASMAFLGLLTPLALFAAMGAAVSGGVLRSYLGFAATVKQGDFHIGFRVIPEYLWAAEGPMLLVLLAAFGFAFMVPASGRPRRLLWWSCMVAGLYAGLVVFSDIIPVFMVYGRLSRCLVPFLCLGAGAGAAGFLERRAASRSLWATALLLLVAGLGALNFSVPLRQVFPDRFARVLTREIPGIASGSFGFYRVLGDEPRLKPLLDDGKESPHSREVLHFPSPLQFRPYQFEGFTASERMKLNSLDTSMRVLEVPMVPYDPALWNGYPGPVKLTAIFPRDRALSVEPLASSGSTGQGDIIFVRYLDASHVQFGLEHRGTAPIQSKAVEIDYRRSHQLVISAGSLLPPAGSGLYRRQPWLEPMTGHLLVMMDGRTVLSRHCDFYPHPPSGILFGLNLIGGPTVALGFTGEVTDLGQAPLDQVARSIDSITAAFLARGQHPEWVGPVRIRFDLPPAEPDTEVGQPLASLVAPGLRQVLLIRREAGKERFCLDTFGSNPTWSDPLDLPSGGTGVVDVSMGSLLPDKGAPLYKNLPGLVELRNMTVVRLNGRIVLLAHAKAAASGSCKVEFGTNLAGSTACGPYFNGDIDSIEPIGLQEITTGEGLPPYFLTRLARPGWAGHTGPLRIALAFADSRAGDQQPVLTTGVPGAGDVVFVRYESKDRARICVDHWGRPLLISDSVEVSPGSVRELTLSLGSLFPPEGPGSSANDGRIRIALDGRTILDRRQECYPCSPGSVTVGSNFIGGSSTGPEFLGKIIDVNAAP